MVMDLDLSVDMFEEWSLGPAQDSFPHSELKSVAYRYQIAAQLWKDLLGY